MPSAHFLKLAPIRVGECDDKRSSCFPIPVPTIALGVAVEGEADYAELLWRQSGEPHGQANLVDQYSGGDPGRKRQAFRTCTTRRSWRDLPVCWDRRSGTLTLDRAER
jgi:hypothetical protein